MIKFKSGILERLKSAGYTTYKLRKENILGQATIQAIRECQELSYSTVDRLCQMMGCQPGDILEYVEDEKKAP